MFDEEWDAEAAAYYNRQAALLDLIDERDVLGDLPEMPFLPDEAPPAPTDAEICAAVAGRGSRLDPAMLVRLDSVDVDALAGDGAVDAAVAFDRVANRVAARRMRAVATAVRRQLGSERVDPIRLASAELAAALAIGSRSIGAEVTCALALTGPLTRTLAAMETGDVSYGKARVLGEQTLDLFDDQAQAVEALVLDAAPGRTWAQHAAAVRRAVVRVDPRAPERRRKSAERARRLVHRSGDDGLAELIVTLPTAQVDAAYTAADAWARARKAAGDDRTLQMLRAAAIARWATSYLTHGDPTTCDHTCDRVPTPDTGDAEPQVDPDTGEILDPSPPPPPSSAASTRRAPTRHGKPLRVGLVWDLPSLLGLADHPGELLDSGEVLAAADMRALITGGIGLRRMLIDADGEPVDLTSDTWALHPQAAPPGTGPAHGQPMWIGILVEHATWQAWTDRTLTGDLATAITLAPRPIRDLLDAPRTDHTLDTRPDADTPSAPLAESLAVRDRHPTTPTAAPTAAAAGDTDHAIPRSAGGPTTRTNLHTPTRRWHVLRTHGGWRLRAHPRGGWIWTSPQGRTYRTRPHDYRRGP